MKKRSKILKEVNSTKSRKLVLKRYEPVKTTFTFYKRLGDIRILLKSKFSNIYFYTYLPEKIWKSIYSTMISNFRSGLLTNDYQSIIEGLKLSVDKKGLNIWYNDSKVIRTFSLNNCEEKAFIDFMGMILEEEY
jgi:hypothetical protein